MEPALKFPDVLTITGYKGAGKDAVTEEITELYKKNGVTATILSTGDLGRERIKKGGLFGERLAEIHNRGQFYPSWLADAMVLMKMADTMKEQEKFLLIGGPRSHEQAVSLKKWNDSGFFGSIRCLEVIASQEIRAERLHFRTLFDKRTDLSYDDHPGILDPKKLRNADAEYKKDREAIVRFLVAAGMYLQIINEGSLLDTKTGLKLLFAT